MAPERFQNASETFMFKKGVHGNLADSRQKPWERSLRSFQEHPRLGLGFGAADNSAAWRLTMSPRANSPASAAAVSPPCSRLPGFLVRFLLVSASCDSS